MKYELASLENENKWYDFSYFMGSNVREDVNRKYQIAAFLG